MDKYVKQALLEYNSEETAAHPGGTLVWKNKTYALKPNEPLVIDC